MVKRAASFPSLKRISVGMLITPYVSAAGFHFSPRTAVTSYSAKSTSPAYSAESSSNVGLSFMHGAHHGAQKSTRTGMSALSTLSSYVLSVTSMRLSSSVMGISPSLLGSGG